MPKVCVFSRACVAKRAYTKHANSTYYKQKSNHSKRAKKQQKQQTSIQCEQIIVKYGLILVWKPEKTEHQRHKDTKNEEVAPARTCNKTTHVNLLNLPKKTIKHSTKPLQKMRQACTCTYVCIHVRACLRVVRGACACACADMRRLDVSVSRCLGVSVPIPPHWSSRCLQRRRPAPCEVDR